MFTTEMLEANQTEVVLQDLSYDTLEQLVSFAYCGELRISAGNVQSIMIGANFLQVDEAKDYHLIPERRPYLRSFRTKARCCNDVPGLMFAIGGLSTGGDSLSTVEMYDPLTKRWTPVRSMTSFRSRVGIAVHDRKIYAIGGFNGHDRLKIVESYDYNKNEWTPVAPLTKKRSALAAAFFNNKLYVCGGYDGITSLATVEVYCPEKNTWELGESMTKQRSAAGVAVLDGYLYGKWKLLRNAWVLVFIDLIELNRPRTRKERRKEKLFKLPRASSQNEKAIVGGKSAEPGQQRNFVDPLAGLNTQRIESALAQ
ncbi:kelch repeat protein [Teladorsagia circumcincta]|uniref:Kelch repeat protein n=1 Tax=Teladorsagia circumcincta TaxID=45464 RepID=A0A2G9U813_TELCI|nr:kelch repeat protein [Teladorsagia circumcincta]